MFNYQYEKQLISSKVKYTFKNLFWLKKLGRNPRSDHDLCEKGNKSLKKK